MVEWHLKSRRTKTGAIRSSKRRSDKKLVWRGGLAAKTTVVEKAEQVERKTVRKRGSVTKTVVKKGHFVNVVDPATHKSKRMELIAVIENKADRQFARRNIITKGAVVKAKDGSKEAYVKITSSPGQDGVVNGKILADFIPEKEIKKEKAKKEAKHKEKKADKSEKDRKTSDKE